MNKLKPIEHLTVCTRSLPGLCGLRSAVLVLKLPKDPVECFHVSLPVCQVGVVK